MEEVPEFEISLDSHCQGKCAHDIKFHTVKLKQSDGSYEMACAKVDCGCMAYEGQEFGEA